MSKFIPCKELLDRWDIQIFELYAFLKEGLKPYSKNGTLIHCPHAHHVWHILTGIISEKDKMKEDINHPDFPYNFARLDLIKYKDSPDQLRKRFETEIENHLTEREPIDKDQSDKHHVSWKYFVMPENEEQAEKIVGLIEEAYFDIDNVSEIEKQLGLISAPEVKKSGNRKSTLLKLKVQAVAKALYEKNPEIDSIGEMINHPKIKECFVGERSYKPKTRHRWIAEVAPQKAKAPGIRHKK